MNVLDATLKRLELIFIDFEYVCVSVSGGKDSSTMVQLVNIVAKKI
jgi:predicted phosphoadenosine phosphosulfate sulfurtransferase